MSERYSDYGPYLLVDIATNSIVSYGIDTLEDVVHEMAAIVSHQENSMSAPMTIRLDQRHEDDGPAGKQIHTSLSGV